MSLHNGIDTVAFITEGFYTKTYGNTGKVNIANLFAFYGLLEDAPIPVPVTRWLNLVVDLVKQPFEEAWKCVSSGIEIIRRSWSEDYDVIHDGGIDLLTRKSFSEDYFNTGQDEFEMVRQDFSEDYVDSIEGIKLGRQSFSENYRPE